MLWHIGAPVEADNGSAAPPGGTPSREVSATMELQADKKVVLRVSTTDEMGNPTTDDATLSWASQDESRVRITDNGDGTAEAAAVGPVGATVVEATGTRISDGKQFSGAIAINVIAGDTEAIAIEAGEATEVTPDDGAAPAGPGA
jgi:hypothetical protein